MENEILVVGIKPFDFEDTKSGKSMKGVTVHYISNDYQEGIGSLPVKATLSIDKKDDFTEVPGLYKAKYTPVNRNGKLELKMSDVDLVSGVDLYGFFS